MRSKFIIIIASLLGSLSIYCAQSAMEPERSAKADASSGGSGGATSGACCDTTPKWSKIAEGTLGGKSGAEGLSGPIDVSAYKELSILRTCSGEAKYIFISPRWGAEAGGLFSYLNDNFDAGRFRVVAPMLKITVGTDSTTLSGSCNYVLVGVK